MAAIHGISHPQTLATLPTDLRRVLTSFTGGPASETPSDYVKAIAKLAKKAGLLSTLSEKELTVKVAAIAKSSLQGAQTARDVVLDALHMNIPSFFRDACRFDPEGMLFHAETGDFRWVWEVGKALSKYSPSLITDGLTEKNCFTLAALSAAAGHLEPLTSILENETYRSTFPNDGLVALLTYSAVSENSSCLERILDDEALSREALDEVLQQTLELAGFCGSIDCVKLLLKRFPDFPFSMYHFFKYSAQGGSLECMQIVLENESYRREISASDNEGFRTAFLEATKNGAIPVMELLLSLPSIVEDDWIAVALDEAIRAGNALATDRILDDASLAAKITVAELGSIIGFHIIGDRVSPLLPKILEKPILRELLSTCDSFRSAYENALDWFKERDYADEEQFEKSVETTLITMLCRSASPNEILPKMYHHPSISAILSSPELSGIIHFIVRIKTWIWSWLAFFFSFFASEK